MNHRVAAIAIVVLTLVSAARPGAGSERVRPASERFGSPEVVEVPDFQRHVLPLMGRLGCNTRSCHGSFQGQGGFRLSLFGYDFKADHEALLKAGADRVVRDDPEASKILQKPTLEVPHKGGKRLEPGSWQYAMFVRWIEAGAKGAEDPSHFERLEVVPAEISFRREGERVPLRVVAHWGDGSSEDVTCISRFRTNDESVAEVDDDGMVTSRGKGDTHVVAFYDNGVAVSQVLLPVSGRVGPRYPDVAAPTRIDELVLSKLRKLGIVPSDPCSDSEFLRRVSLDMTGTLPTPEEVVAFLADASPAKREHKIDELLARPSYAAWWTTKLCDFTGDSPQALVIQQNATRQPAKHWYDWIYRRVKENMPYDRLVAGIVLATSRKPGQSYEDYVAEESSYHRAKDPADYSARETMPYYWMRRDVRQPEEKALNFSYAFLGVRLECAQCHKHPFDQWTQDDFKQFSAFFAPVRYGYAPGPEMRESLKKINEGLGVKPKDAIKNRQILAASVVEGKVVPWQEVFIAPAGTRAGAGGKGKAAKAQGGNAGRVLTPKLLGGDEVALGDRKDPREPLMDWMRDRGNPYFARAFVNRVWANYFGSGIINPPDDMNLANPPSNAALLDYLADGFVAHGFDMRWLHREIATSQAYQRSWRTNDTNRLDERNFSRALLRRLPAEVLIDAVAQATASPADLVKRAMDPEDRAIGPKAQGGVNGRKGGDYASKVFGRATRDTNCDCSRSNQPNLLQAIYLQNDQDLLTAIERPGGWVAETTAASVKGRAARKDPAAPTFDVDQAIRLAYFRTVGRSPSEEEMETSRDYLGGSADARKGLRDLLWALLNTKEFFTNH